MSNIMTDVFNMDCMEYMRQVPDKAFDLVVADPPYGIGADKPSKKNSTVLQRNGLSIPVKQNVYNKKEWDAQIPSIEFFTELKRISRNQIIFGANYFGLQGGMVVWDKMNGDSDQFGCEIAYQSFNKRTDIVHYMWSGMMQGVYCGTDIGKAQVQQGNKSLNEERIHPTQKPVALYAYLLRKYANQGDSIFDPMMGSQSLRIAAYKLGYDYVGCEIDKEYFDRGCARFMFECNGIQVLPSGKTVEQLSIF